MQKTKLPSLITVLILTLVTVVAWVGFSIYRAFTTAPAPSVPKDVSASLSPSLDTQTVSQIEGRLFFSDTQVPEVNITATSTPAPVATPIATPSSSPSATPEATASATPIL